MNAAITEPAWKSLPTSALTEASLAAVANPAGLTFNNVELACIYYQAGQPAGITTQYIHDLAEQGVVKFSTPYISTPDGSVLLSFDSYEILVLETDYNID